MANDWRQRDVLMTASITHQLLLLVRHLCHDGGGDTHQVPSGKSDSLDIKLRPICADGKVAAVVEALFYRSPALAAVFGDSAQPCSSFTPSFALILNF